jgi:hypothetical protein
VFIIFLLGGLSMNKKLEKKQKNKTNKTLFSYGCGCTCGCYSPGSGRPQEYDSHELLYQSGFNMYD